MRGHRDVKLFEGQSQSRLVETFHFRGEGGPDWGVDWEHVNIRKP